MTTMPPKFRWVYIFNSKDDIEVENIVFHFVEKDMVNGYAKQSPTSVAFTSCQDDFAQVDHEGVIQPINLNLWDTGGMVLKQSLLSSLKRSALILHCATRPCTNMSGFLGQGQTNLHILPRKSMTLFDLSVILER